MKALATLRTTVTRYKRPTSRCRSCRLKALHPRAHWGACSSVRALVMAVAGSATISRAVSTMIPNTVATVAHSPSSAFLERLTAPSPKANRRPNSYVAAEVQHRAPRSGSTSMPSSTYVAEKKR
jgi:hypothetical protein